MVHVSLLQQNKQRQPPNEKPLLLMLSIVRILPHNTVQKIKATLIGDLTPPYILPREIISIGTMDSLVIGSNIS